MNPDKNIIFVPDDTFGTVEETATVLVGTATEKGIEQRDIASTHGGYWITEALADALDLEFEDEDAEDAEDEDADSGEDLPAEPEKPTKTSGNRAAKNVSQEGE